MTPIEAKALALVAVGNMEAKSAKEEQKRAAIRETLLSDNEIERLTLNMIEGNPPAVTDENINLMLRAARDIRMASTCLELAIKGLVTINIDPNEPECSVDRLMFKHRTSISPVLTELFRAQEREGR